MCWFFKIYHVPNEKMYLFISDNRTYHFQAEDEQEYVA